ncbi:MULTISPECIES: enolase C-terminal domain-like protein [unclassified Streptomyces]|uniref:enolase C-terminal domain-like protein n=1 Tax=unclassified Streptomyces TaxID=2593676 RepID=UPI000DC7878B|nr:MULTISPECIES: enolase C-terminal domain-like protein [unclassified Streptomyces]AWZ07195.1 dipeptide epimerase [Streptomyces sp. ICC4]AWZ16606.1 dipeptide epimerase [Streptomyces sp. ICC1]
MKLSWSTTELELAEPLRISRSVMARRDAVWVTVEHGGLRGWGEAVSSDYLGLPTTRIIEHLVAARPGIERLPDPETAWDEYDAGSPPGLPAGVLAAIEAALLDLVGKRADRPVHQLLGTHEAPAAATARTIGIIAPEAAAAQATRLAAAGFTVLKVKAGHPDPARDLHRVAAVHCAVPGASLLLDPNGAWSEHQALALLPRFAALGVTAVEQPIAPGRPDALARVAKESPVPVIADEDAVSYEDAVALAGRVHGVNVKLAKCGGVRAALRIHEALRGSGTDLMLGCLTASSLGIAPAVHIADRARWVDLDGHLLLADDPWTGIGGADGTVRAASRSGLGVRRADGEAGR